MYDLEEEPLEEPLVTDPVVDPLLPDPAPVQEDPPIVEYTYDLRDGIPILDGETLPEGVTIPSVVHNPHILDAIPIETPPLTPEPEGEELEGVVLPWQVGTCRKTGNDCKQFRRKFVDDKVTFKIDRMAGTSTSGQEIPNNERGPGFFYIEKHYQQRLLKELHFWESHSFFLPLTGI
jgi:hypothetical protein